MKRFFGFIFVVCFFLSLTYSSFSKEYRAAVKELPPVTDNFVNILKAVVEATGNTVDVQVVPPARADKMISDREVDIQYPIIIEPDKNKREKLNYDFSGAITYQVAFVLYTTKNKKIDVESIRNGNPKKYKIEVDTSRVGDYDFPVIPTTNFETTMKRVNDGSIDGAILSQNTGDPFIKKLKLTNIKRQLWYNYEETFSIQKGAKGGEVDKMLIEGMKKIKANGKYDQIVGPMANASKYNDWQP